MAKHAAKQPVKHDDHKCLTVRLPFKADIALNWTDLQGRPVAGMWFGGPATCNADMMLSIALAYGQMHNCAWSHSTDVWTTWGLGHRPVFQSPGSSHGHCCAVIAYSAIHEFMSQVNV